MKLNKIFAIALAALTLTACSDDDDNNFLGGVNSAKGVTVEMGNSQFTAQESEEFFYVPVAVTGETNGKVVVTVEIRQATPGAEQEGAVEGTHYVVTSKTINIAAQETTGFIEIGNNWETGVINPDRVLDIAIVKAEGATIGAQSTCTVTIQNSDNPYTMLCGNWHLTALDRNGNEVDIRPVLKTPSNSAPEFGNELWLAGVMGDSDYMIRFTDFSYDEETGKGTMKLGYGTMMTDGLAFNYGDVVGVAYPVMLGRNAFGNLSTNLDVECTFDSEMNEIVIPENAMVIGGLFSNSTGQYTGYTIGQYSSIKLTR